MRKQLLQATPSGNIELVFTDKALTLEFNCDCMDALPYCRAMCCRLRPIVNTTVLSEERRLYAHMPHPNHPELNILQTKANGFDCIYLGEDDKCAVHYHKPQSCRRYHCSPGGNPNDEQIERRDYGWMLLPLDVAV